MFLLELANLDFLAPVIDLIPSFPPCESIGGHFRGLNRTVVPMPGFTLRLFHFSTFLITALEGVELPPVVPRSRLILLLLLSVLFVLLISASFIPCCPLTLLPGDPPPVLMYTFPIVPFSGELLDVPVSHPLSAPETEDSMKLIIPAPPLRDRPFRYTELRV